jgi:hypothetical protein
MRVEACALELGDAAGEGAQPCKSVRLLEHELSSHRLSIGRTTTACSAATAQRSNEM